MSFILDALKKSETDRQRQSGPSLFEVKIAPPRRALPVWAVAIAALLGINMIVISWMLLRHPAAQQPASASNAPASAPPAAHATPTSGGAVSAVQGAQAGPGATEPASNGRSTAAAAYPPGAAAGTGAPGPAALRGPMAGAGTGAPGGTMASAGTAGSGGAAGSAGTAPLASGSAAARAEALDRSPAAASAASNAGPGNAQATASDQSDFEPAVQPAAGQAASAQAAGDLPLYQQIVSSAGLPALHLDLHVFADRPQDRFVMINMHRLGEGDSLPDGVHVEAIRPDGVVLRYHGTRFLLPRN